MTENEHKQTVINPVAAETLLMEFGRDELETALNRLYQLEHEYIDSGTDRPEWLPALRGMVETVLESPKEPGA